MSSLFIFRIFIKNLSQLCSARARLKIYFFLLISFRYFLKFALVCSELWDLTVGCPKMHQNAHWLLLRCMWLSLYHRSHQQKFISFMAFLWSGHIFRVYKGNSKKYKGKYAIFALISCRKDELT
jgi:hypothetical protein